MENINRFKEGNSARTSRPLLRLFFWPVLLILVLVLIGFIVYKMFFSASLIKPGYQAVFLTNGQVYFGNLGFRNDWAVLSDVYYLQATDALQQKSFTADSKNVNQNIQLIKLGGEIHGPLDTMYIEHDKILFWENLKESSKVAEAIKRDKSNQKIVNSSSQGKF